MSVYLLSRRLGLCAVLLSTLISCQQEAQQEAEAPKIRPAKIHLVADPSKETIRNFPAEVEANEDSQMAFRVSGQIIEFPVKAGNEVKKGQLLARLDPKDFKLRLDDRQARFNLALSQFERAKSLLEKKLVSPSDFDEAKANLAVAESSLNTAKSELEYTYLRAPYAGSIARVMVENYENIQAKQTILTLQTRDQIDISIQVPESIISRVKKGSNYQPTVIFDAYKGKEYLVTVKEWDTQADPSTLTYKVVFSLPTPDEFNLLPGMTANIRIDLSKVTTIEAAKFTVPVSAVFAAEDQPVDSPEKFVWRVNPETMQVSRVAVTVGEMSEQGIEIISGIKAGDLIVSAGVHFLSEGMKVRAWDREKGL